MNGNTGAPVTVRGVTKRFGGVTAVDGLSFDVAPGACLGIIGPNGAGKSTMLKLLAGALRPDEGEILVGGHRIDRLAAHRVPRTGIALASQIPRPFPALSVRDNLAVAAAAAPTWPHRQRGHHHSVAEVLGLCGLRPVADRPATSLGLLDRKRIELGRALVSAPRLLLLDEVAAGLVGTELQQIVDLIRRVRETAQPTLIVVEHVEGVVRQLVDDVLVLNWGREVTRGTPAQIEADEQVREIYLGVSGKERKEQAAAVAAPCPEAAPAPASGGEAPPPLALHADRLTAGYGDLIAIRDVSIEVKPGQVVALLGANGAGKSTLAAAISGLVPAVSGRVLVHGTDLTRSPAYVRARQGVAHCPEGRRIFGDLTVRENLAIVVGTRRTSRSQLAGQLAEVYGIFPALAKRQAQRAGTLSGGQQQMLAIGRALMARPTVLVCDEISLGLAPVAIDALYDAISAIHASGVAVLLVEQSIHRSLSIASYAYVLERGTISYAGDPAPLHDESVLHRAYFGTRKEEQKIWTA